jgi:hypothetical protein
MHLANLLEYILSTTGPSAGRIDVIPIFCGELVIPYESVVVSRIESSDHLSNQHLSICILTERGRTKT